MSELQLDNIKLSYQLGLIEPSEAWRLYREVKEKVNILINKK